MSETIPSDAELDYWINSNSSKKAIARACYLAGQSSAEQMMLDVIRQALAALEMTIEFQDAVTSDGYAEHSIHTPSGITADWQSVRRAINNLRAVIEQIEDAKPIGYFYKHGDEWLQDKYGDYESIPLYTTPPDAALASQAAPSQEPVAWMYTDRKGWKQANFEGPHDLYKCTPLYAHPAAELAECRKDAERYRWLINNATTVRVQGGEYILTKNFDNMTKHIDAAMKEAKP